MDLLQRVRGMFTFVIWDKNKQELFGARDHFGIKPFYYAKMNGTFMYASEIKEPVAPPLTSSKELNDEAFKPYMTFQYPAIGGTFFKGVFKLPEGHYFTYRDGKMDIHRVLRRGFPRSLHQAGPLVDTIDQTVCDSVKAHQIADVEVGSSCRAVSTPATSPPWRVPHTYSIGFGKGTYNESQQAGELAELLKLNNTAESLTDEGGVRCVPAHPMASRRAGPNPELRAAVLPVRIGRQGREGGAERRRRRRVVRRIHRLRRAHQIQAHQGGGDSLAHASASRRAQGDRRFCKGKTFPGAWHLAVNLAPAEESFIGQARV